MDQPAGRRTPRSGGPERSEGFGAAEHNSDTKKEAVSRTYQGVDGYTPIALYLGNEGWNIGLELRPGSNHSGRKTEYFLERVFPRLERLCPQDAKVLLRADSGFDSARLFAPAGAVGLTGEIAPIRHPAKRRRIKTVLQEIMYRAAQLVTHARRLVLDFGRNVAQHVKVFVALQERLLQAASP